MFIHYDKEGDYLEIHFGKPEISYYEKIGRDVFQRRNEKDGKVRSYAIFNVLKRKQVVPKDIELEVPEISAII
ncbi:hypothetical protein HYX16_04220 [Candidatus Woesearchaeota archaeon]|nr:hypothetical protein [Candidatus Woesearchaeota archaeon]